MAIIGSDFETYSALVHEYGLQYVLEKVKEELEELKNNPQKNVESDNNT